MTSQNCNQNKFQSSESFGKSRRRGLHLQGSERKAIKDLTYQKKRRRTRGHGKKKKGTQTLLGEEKSSTGFSGGRGRGPC